MLDAVLQDFRFALRSLRKRPVLLLVPVLSLSLGIGANTVIFTLVDDVLLSSPVGIPNAGRVIEVGRGREGRGFDTFAYPDFVDLRREAEPIEALAGYEMQMLTLSRGEAGERVFGMLVSANYFEILGVHPALGRAFRPEEDTGPDEHPVLVLGHGLWKSRMGGDTAVVGSTVYLNRKPYTVVGVAPEGFGGHIALANVDVYVPLMQHPSLNRGRNWFENRGGSWFQVLGLLRSDASLEEADAAVSTVFRRLAEEYPDTNARRTASVRAYGPLPAAIRGPATTFLGILTALVGLILLITCANVAGILLARAGDRRREIAIRMSVGSGRRRLLRHFMMESVIIFLMGAAGGILLAVWGLDILASVELPAPIPLAMEFALDGRVVAFALAVTLAAGLLFGFLPARQAVTLDLLEALKDGEERRGSPGGRLRRGFVASQVGASLVLLVAAGLLLRALQEAGEIEKGFNADGAFLTFLDLSAEGLGPEESETLQGETLQYFRSRPWVEAVSLAIDLPLDLGAYGTGVLPEGWQPREDRPYLGVDYNVVSPGYFAALEIPVLDGRVFDEGDREGTESVVVISRRFADQVWPGVSPLGRRVLWGAEGDDWLTVVGVVEDVHNQFLTEEPSPYAYRPLAQYPNPEAHLVLRTALDESRVAQEVHQGLRRLDPRLSVAPVIRLDRYTAVGILPQRVAGTLATALGLLALLLSGMGVYGLMAYTVSRRSREMGIRSALGARPGEVLKLVLMGGLRLALPGLVLGLMVAVGVARLLRSLLLGVSPLDPWAFGSVALVVVMVLVGTAVPAGRAARVDPAEALRYD